MGWVKGQSGNVAGRPKGAKDKVSRRGSIRRAYEEFIAVRGGHEKFVEAIDSGVADRKRALGFLELGARVLDRIDQQNGQAGPSVTIVLQSSLRLDRLRTPEVLARARVPALSPGDTHAH